MAKTKTVETKKEVKITEEKTVEEKTKAKMLKNYVGTKGIFLIGKTYELESDFVNSLVKNGDALKC